MTVSAPRESLETVAARVRAFRETVGETEPGGVQLSADLRRIQALPAKCNTVDGIPPAYAVPDMTDSFRRVPRAQLPWSLNWVQSQALYEAPAADGLVGIIGVGWGKELLSFLLPRAWQSKCAVIVEPANLLDHARSEYERLAPFWDLPELGRELHLISYNKLSDERTAAILEQLQPDVVVFNESHNIRHMSSARGSRFVRFFRKHRATVRLAPLSGTFISRELAEVFELMGYTLGSMSPVPLHQPTVVEWDEALEVRPQGEKRRPPGALRLLFASKDEEPRKAIQRRICATPGVVATSSSSTPAALTLERWKPRLDLKVLSIIEEVAKTWTLPTGEEFVDSLTLYRTVRQLCGGFFYSPDPAGEEEHIRLLRQAWERQINHQLRYRRRAGFDSRGLVVRAAERGEWTCPEWEMWKEARNESAPATLTHWVSDALVEAAREDMWSNQQKPTVYWVLHEPVMERLLQLELPMDTWDFPAGEKHNRHLVNLAASQDAGQCHIIASVRAHGTGKHLHKWARQVFLEMPAGNDTVQQAIGRSHRPGLRADIVEVLFGVPAWPAAMALDRAMRQARFVSETTPERQKLITGTWVETRKLPAQLEVDANAGVVEQAQQPPDVEEWQHVLDAITNE